MKHFDPHFAKDRWRALVEERRGALIRDWVTSLRRRANISVLSVAR